MIHEVLLEVKNTKEKNTKIEILRKNFTPGLREVIKYAYSPNLKFFTNQVPKYKADHAPEGMNFNSLFNECKRFYILTEMQVEQTLSGKITNIKRKNEILIQILENIHPKEAEVLSHMITGDFADFYGISKTLIKETFPNIIGK